jgi:hypothetical protein
MTFLVSFSPTSSHFMFLWSKYPTEHPVLKHPHVLPARVNGRDYLNFLRIHLGALMEDTPFNWGLHLYFQHDGAIPHFNQEVCQRLSANYAECWAGRGKNAPVKLDEACKLFQLRLKLQ